MFARVRCKKALVNKLCSIFMISHNREEHINLHAWNIIYDLTQTGLFASGLSQFTVILMLQVCVVVATD